MLIFSAGNLFAQDDNPVAALDKINAAIESFNIKYLAYQSALAHGSKVRKCERKRQEMLTQLDNARYAIIEVPYYKGDKTLHQGSIAYLKLISDVLNENYQKIVNLEDISEQSYDAMEAYILLKKKVDERMEEAGAQFHDQVVAYCNRQNIKLVKDVNNENNNKMKIVGEVMDYYNKIYLAFFKSSVQETNFMEALGKKNVTALEQSKSAMEKYAGESLDSLNNYGSFKGDASIKLACKKALDFFKKEAASSTSLTDYFLKEQSFTQVKKSFEQNSKAQSDQAEINKYNTAVDEMNKALNTFNKTNETLNRQRADVYNSWNEAVKNFMDAQIPYAR